MTMTIPTPNAGGSCLPTFAAYLGVPFSGHQAILVSPDQSRQYVVVHMYLVPGRDDRRQALQQAVHTRMDALGAKKLHTMAYAVTCARGAERETALNTWGELIAAGATALGSDGPEAWESGDVVYVHYVGDDGIALIAANPANKTRLPNIHG